MTTDDMSLLNAAKAVRKRAYARYSNYRCGAAIIDNNGQTHVGCNVENAAYPQGICAETNAIGSMVAAGGTAIARIAIVGGGEALEFCTPCGGCRQRIQEFADADTVVILADADGQARHYTMAELLPAAFSLDRDRSG